MTIPMTTQATSDRVSGDTRSEHTKRALLVAAIRLFGRKGYENTSVRDLVDDAGVNLAAVNYHFGSKEGLRLAAIDHLASEFRKDGPGTALTGMTPEKIAAMSVDEARNFLRHLMRSSFQSVSRQENADEKTRFVQRELIQGGKPTELFFEKVFNYQLSFIRLLVSRITGEDPDSDRVKARAIHLIAQSVFLNLARPLVLMAFGWDSYRAESADLMADTFWLYHE